MHTKNIFRQDSQDYAGLLKGIFRFSLILSILLILSSASGCATKPAPPGTPPKPISQDELTRIQLITETVAEEGTIEALLENPGWRPQFEKTWATLDRTIKDGRITPAELRDVVNTLPIDQLKSRDVRLAITGARLVYYASGGNDVTMIDSQSRAYAAALGIAKGMGRALGKTP